MKLSDNIENFIKNMISEEEPLIELKRNELAEYFGCAPSQINYVLSTRFTLDHGYMTESRRGGGGYIRIVRLCSSPSGQLEYLIQERIGDSLTEAEAVRIIAQLVENGTLTPAAGNLMRSAVSAQALGVPVQQYIKDAIRARTMKSMLLEVARQHRRQED